MSASETIHIFAIDEVLKVSLIDGGDTLAVQLRDTAGDEVAILLSVAVADGLNAQVQANLRETAHRPNRTRPKADLPAGGHRSCARIDDAPITHLPLNLVGA